MARRARSTTLETPDARKKLPVSKKPVFAAKIGRGLTLGYRRNKAAGTWVVRVADGKGGNWIAAIGTADDNAPADNRDILDFWQAQDHARAKARRGKDDDSDGGGSATIAEALDRYEADLRVRAGDVGNVARVKAHLPVGLARKSVALVTTRELRSWRDGLADGLAPATVNRTTNALKARSTSPPTMTSASSAAAPGEPGWPQSMTPKSRVM
jgi:hypothetical protein